MKKTTQAFIVLIRNDRLGLAIEQHLIAKNISIETRTELVEHSSETLTLIQKASVLVLAGEDDAQNVDLALTVRRLQPDLPLVIRLFDAALVTSLKRTLNKISILSMSTLVAPVITEAAIQAIQSKKTPHTTLRLHKTRRRMQLDRVLLSTCLALLGLITFSTWFFSYTLKLSAIDALYFVWTTIMTVGYGDITLKESSAFVKIAGMLLMFAGASFMAVLFALITGWVVSRRLDILRGRVQVRGQGHTIIAGGGNLGFQVAMLLHEHHQRVVVIERNAESRHIGALRAVRHHVILADATNDEIFNLAGVDGASVVLALTDSDATNLHIALLVRAIQPSIPVIMRVESPELSAHVAETHDAIAISPIAVAASAFTEIALSAASQALKEPSS